MQRSELLVIFCALFFTALTPLALDGYAPSLPAITHNFQTTASLTQLTMSLFLFGSAVSQLIYGPMSDKFGRKKIILSGIFLCLVGSILCVFSRNIFYLIAARFIQGAGAGSMNALFRAVMRDSFSGARLAKVASIFGLVFAGTLAFSPVLGGYLEVHFGWKAIFIFIIGFSAFVGLQQFLLFPETNRHMDPHAMRMGVLLKNYLHLFTNRSFLGYTFCSMLSFAAFMIYFAVGPFLLENDLGLSPLAFGYLSLWIGLCITIGQFTNMFFVEKIGVNDMLRLGVYGTLLSGSLLLLFSLFHIFTIYTIVGPILLLGATTSLIFANAMAGAFEPFAHMAGIAGAAYGSIQILGSALITSLVALFPPKSLTFGTAEILLAFATWLCIRFLIPNFYQPQQKGEAL